MDNNLALIRTEENGSISFGNYFLKEKTKQSDFEHKGDIYKVKTFNEMTKLEKNGLFVYESVPGTTVNNFQANENEISFLVTGNDVAQITLGLEEEQNYEVFVDKSNIGTMKTNLGGKLSLSIEFEVDKDKEVVIKKQ